MKALYALVLSITTFAPFHEAAGQSTKDPATSIDQIIEQKVAESGIVGIGAAVIVDKKLVWSKGFGYADKDNKKPFTTDTVMNIGSIAKNFTGVCLMRAVEEGLLSLDEDINRYLPFKVVNPYHPDEKITLRHLATHSSGLADRHPFYGDNYNYKGGPDEELGSFLKNYFATDGKYYSKENFLDHKPGTYYQYSNIPASLAGYIVEIVTGKKLQELGRKNIFKPLKMDRTGWSLSEIKRADHTILYEKKENLVSPIPLYTFPTYPEGGVRTTVSSLAKYFTALLNGGEYKGVRILKEESVEEMQRFQFNAANKPANMNLAKLNSGIFWATKQGATRIGHAGSDPGIKAEMLTDLNKEVGVILFTNTGLSEQDLVKYHFGIFDELYKYGVKLRDSKHQQRTRKKGSTDSTRRYRNG